MIYFAKRAVVTLMLIGAAGSAQAQVGPQLSGASFDHPDVQARATLTFPFGGTSTSPATQPRFAIGFRSESRTALSDRDWTHVRTLQPREVSLGFTLERQPTVLLNDHILLAPERLSADDAGEGERQAKGGGLDTYDKTVLTIIAASLAVIGGTIIVLAE